MGVTALWFFGLHVATNGNLIGDSAMTIWNDASGPVPGLVSTAHANGTTNGQWKPIPLPNGSWQFQNKNSGQCLDVYGGSSSPGVQLDQWPCKSGAAGGNQAFATR